MGLFICLIEKPINDMDGQRVRTYFSNEVKTLLDLYKQFEVLVPSDKVRGAAHVGEDGRYVEALLRECLGKFLPKGIELLTGFIMRPATKTGVKNRERDKEKDSHSKQLDIIVYDSAHYPVYQRFDKNVVVPPEGVIGIISVKKKLYLKDIEKEVKSLYEASHLCKCINDNKDKVRGPYLAIVAMDSAYKGGKDKIGKLVFTKISGFYQRQEIADDLSFNDTVGLITALTSYSIFKRRPKKKNVQKAEYIEIVHKENEKYMSLQFILTGLLSVYYDPTRNLISRPGFTSFKSGRNHDNYLGSVNVIEL